jgi:hypothetical protein
LVYVGDTFTGELMIAGALPKELDDPDYAICLYVYVDDVLTRPSCASYLPSRYVSLAFFPYSKQWFMWRKGWGRRGFGDFDEEIHSSFNTPIDGDTDTIRSEIRIELWLAEPNPENWIKSKPFKVLLQVDRSIRVDCRECLAPTVDGVATK